MIQRLAAVVVIGVVGALLTSHPLAGQQVSLEYRFSGETLNQLNQQVEAAEAAGLPTDPLVQKALEGWSKGASDAQVVAAVRALRGRLTIAVSVLGSDAEGAAVVAAAAALYLGMDSTSLSLVAGQVAPSTLPIALIVIGDLVKRGVPPAKAEEAILSLARIGADISTLRRFRQQVETDIRTGAIPGTATDLRYRGIVSSLRGGGVLPLGGRP